jgi:hypothetical protein
VVVPERLALVYLALVYLALVAVPVAIFVSPVSTARQALWWGVSLALYVAVASMPRRFPAECAALWRLRLYLAWGAGVALFYQRFHPNELAGILLLFLPMTLTLALSPGLAGGRRRRLERRLWRFQLLLLTGLFGGLLLRTQSRGAFLAGLVAVVLVLILSGSTSRRFLVLATVVAVPIIVLARRWLVDVLVFSGSVQGLTTDVVLTGRPVIWDQALRAIGDFPFTGIGLGAFGSVIPKLYPRGIEVDHAHNLYLQLGLDLGIPGLVAVVVFVGALLGRLGRMLVDDKQPGWKRSRRIGILASLTAYLLHAGVDAVPPGTAGGVAFFFLCGLAAAERPSTSDVGRARPLWWSVAVVASVVVGLVSPPGQALIRLNRASWSASKALVADPSHLDAAAQRLAAVPLCRARWLEGVVAARQGRVVERDAAWSELVVCSGRYFHLLERVALENRPLAVHAIAVRGEDAGSHLYLARVLRAEGLDSDRRQAIDAYRRGLVLDDSDARAWIELADLLVAAGRRREALVAYDESCRRGDPGANACWRGGQTAEALGERETAIRFYEQSRWSVARRRGEELAAVARGRCAQGSVVLDQNLKSNSKRPP